MKRLQLLVLQREFGVLNQGDELHLFALQCFILRIKNLLSCWSDAYNRNALFTKQGWPVVRALASHQCGPGSIPGLGVMWVEFVVGSRPCSEGFSPGTPVFLCPQKPTFPNSYLTWKQRMEEPPRGIH